ncbi:YaiI/YqxD family protein [Bacillus ginsengihumi]|uniref:UPF0178 protein G4D61_06855 n=1 Tax=Heyndrickxia ginsengihumi TaxID=363870 RepID=A0A6M0P727_9BACI|nr:YaiI/YqxD family protein [Heyndrickxia ginsengihumi]MBE6183951.1 YaiI/YqxD family protein [Bacillus sp. (in: firmicutes)]MCM3021757.1 YaiI/YqxD family protein [Heyndrickxia ginsengihumi]NEY19690.1 YaiI/YqxD family protein [Heyndrickxia ginsengihumi]
MTIFVDADACPVKEEIITIAQQYEIKVVFVASFTNQMADPVNGIWVYVDPHKESADLYIINHIGENDIVITQDIGLASLVLSKKAYALSPRGKQYEETSINTALDFRYLAAKSRRSGKYEKGPKKFTQKDRETFKSKLNDLLSKFEIRK